MEFVKGFRGLRVVLSVAVVATMLLAAFSVVSSTSVPVTIQPTDGYGVDISISNSDVIVSDANPTDGDSVTLAAVVHGDVGEAAAWVKRGVVLDLGGAGETYMVLSPSVIQLPGGGYAMYYMASASSGYTFQIFRATSADGITWAKQGIVIDKGGSYAGACVYYPYVMLDSDGVYRLWYNGVNYEDGYRSRTLYAYSTDGINFVKTGLDMNFGSASDPAGTHNPYVLNDEGTWRMWYQGTYWSPCFNRICHAHKASLSNAWTKDGTVLSNDGVYDSLHSGRPWVLKTEDGGYEMFYTGIDPSVGRILHATSPDGMSWTRDGIVLEPSLPLETSIAYCSVIKEGDSYKMWYSGYSGSNWRIFYAESVPEEPAVDATCTVSFYLDSVAPENLIGSQAGVFVPANGQATASVDWVAVAGNHTIIACVESVVPADADMSNNVASVSVSVAAPDEPAEITIEKVKLSGIDEGQTLTYYEWELQITVENVGGSPAVDVIVHDVLPAELGLLEMVASSGNTTSVYSSGLEGTRSQMLPTVTPVKSTHITWIVGEMQPGAVETLYLRIFTRVNPGGNQEFTSPGTYSLNDGAWLCAEDSLTGESICEGPTPPITVEIFEMAFAPVGLPDGKLVPPTTPGKLECVVLSKSTFYSFV